MSDFIIAINGTPLPTLLVIFGFIFLFIGITTIKKPIVIDITSSNRKIALILGIIFVGAGLYLLSQPSNEKKENIPTETPTPTAFVALTMTPVPSITQVSTPTPWLLGNQTTTDDKPLCSIIVNDFQETNRENVKRLQFTITGQGGYCSWIIPLNGYNAISKKQVTFWVRGEKGGEPYEVGIKDRKTPSGQEPKVPQMASTSWTQVSIPLRDSFKNQDLSSLENLSLNFKVGSGIIYVDQLIFIP